MGQGASLLHFQRNTFETALLIKGIHCLNASEQDSDLINLPPKAGGNPKQSFPSRNLHHETNAVDFCLVLPSCVDLRVQTCSSWLNQDPSRRAALCQHFRGQVPINPMWLQCQVPGYFSVLWAVSSMNTSGACSHHWLKHAFHFS